MDSLLAALRRFPAVLFLAIAFGIADGGTAAPASPSEWPDRTYDYDALAASTSTTTPFNLRADAERAEWAGTAGSWRPALSDPPIRAPKAAGTAARGGESGAAAFGRQVHRVYNYGPGFRKEFTLGSGRRPDAINFRTREVVELKPNNPAGIRRGQRQLEVYRRDLQQQFPGQEWRTRIETYDPYRGP